MRKIKKRNTSLGEMENFKKKVKEINKEINGEVKNSEPEKVKEIKVENPKADLKEIVGEVVGTIDSSRLYSKSKENDKHFFLGKEDIPEPENVIDKIKWLKVQRNILVALFFLLLFLLIK